MRCAERNWALIRHAGSAPEASIGSKPLGSKLADIHASIAPECQGFVDGRIELLKEAQIPVWEIKA